MISPQSGVDFFHFDTSRLGKVDRTQVGGARVPARLSRTGVLTYINPDGSRRRELRLPSEIFKTDSLATLDHAPVIDIKDHTGMVTPDTWRKVSLGHVVNVRQDGKFIVGDLLVQDQGTLDAIENAERTEISCGYRCTLDMTPGVYEGEAYDCVQRNIRYNHAALCPPGRGRAGSEVGLRLDSNAPAWANTHLDENTEETSMADKIRIDGRDFVIGGEEHIAKLDEINSNLRLDARTLATQLTAAIKRADIAEAERDSAKDALIKLDAEVQSAAAEAADAAPTVIEGANKQRKFRRKLERAVLRFFGDDATGDDKNEPGDPNPAAKDEPDGDEAAGATSGGNHAVPANFKKKKRDFPPGAKAPPFTAKDGGAGPGGPPSGMKRDDEGENTDAFEERIDSMSDRDLMLFAITRVKPDFVSEGKSDDYVAARFDSLIETMRSERSIGGVVRVARAGYQRLDAGEDDAVTAARRARDEHAANAWRTGTP